MRCARCAREVTSGWMKIQSFRVNPHTGEPVIRMLCERCAHADEDARAAADGRDVGARLRDDGGMAL